MVAGRKVGGAVARNRAKRVIRAASRELSTKIGADVDVVWVARTSIKGVRTHELMPEMRDLLVSAGVNP